MKLKGKRLLVVDDETEICRMVQMILSTEGCVCDEANTLKQAREKTTQHRYDAVLTDLQLPDGNGIDLVHELRQDGREHTPAIVVTTGFSHLSKKEVLASGADEFIAKPFDVDELVAALARAIVFRHGAIGA